MDVGEFELCDPREIEDEYVRSEQLSLLRRELAFIVSDYRRIVVAYYMENRSVKEIAKAVSLPEGTVKSKLFRARKILKEGMDMAREFGVKSYKPEEIIFANSCSSFGKNGQPWSILSHLLYKNIFLESYGSPRTAEELSLELGIALPYMEQELKFLVEQTLLWEKDGRYQPSFPIFSRQVREKCYRKTAEIAPTVTELLEGVVDRFVRACKAHGIDCYGPYVEYEEAKWILLMRAFDYFQMQTKTGPKLSSHTKRPDNGAWDIIGLQLAEFSPHHFVGLCGEQYKFYYRGIDKKTPEFIDPDEAAALHTLAGGGKCDPAQLEKLSEHGYVRHTDKGYEPAVVVLRQEITQMCKGRFSASELSELSGVAGQIHALFAEGAEYVRAAAVADLPAVYQEDQKMLRYYCRMLMGSDAGCFDRGFVFDRALEDGWLRYDENTTAALGAYVIV